MKTRTTALLLAVALAAQVHAAWTQNTSHDEFEGATRVVASVTVTGEPYNTAAFTLRCVDGATAKDAELAAYFTFGYLNRAGDDKAPLRVKFGDDPPFDWEVHSVAEGRRGLFMMLSVERFEKIAQAESFKVRVAYHNEVGPTTIDFPMEGAREAIAFVMESECGANYKAALAARLAALDAENAYMRARVPCVKHRFARANKEALWRSCMREQGVEPCSVQSCNFPSNVGGFSETACRDICAAGGH